MVQFLLDPFITWLPIIFTWAVLFLAIFAYVFKTHNLFQITWFSWINYKFLSIATIIFIFSYTIILTIAQYYVWANSGSFTGLFLNSPLSPEIPPSFVTNLLPWVFESPLGYFFFYSWGRFWINALLSIGMALVFWLFLRALKKNNERFFYPSETELGFLCALIVGWPSFLVFIPLVFLSVIIVSIIRAIVYREAYTTLGYPFILGAFLSLIWGGWLIDLLNLGVFKI
ncbi:MAG TPA: hypothetical protein VI432_02070 [Candidatus Paceibacterota bacterium]